MTTTVKAAGHSFSAKYAQRARLRTIQRVSLNFALWPTLAMAFLPWPAPLGTACCWLSIAASVVGLLCIAAYHWLCKRQGH